MSLIVAVLMYTMYRSAHAHSTTVTATVAMCDSLKGQLDDSVIISSTDPAVEGTTVIVMFHCPTGSLSFSSTCMKNGEWEPAPNKMNCSG